MRLSTGGDWVRLEFAYDYMGRRIAKKYLRGEGDTTWDLEKAAENVFWGADKFEKFVYDGWMPVAAYKSAIEDGMFLGFTGSWAWGPDLSGTLGGAGGIGGLAIAVDDEWDFTHPSTAVGPMVPLYDGNGNIKRLVMAYDVTIAAAKYEYGPFGEVRSIDGPLGLRNPFRWSTKYTDAETGLVYYGYRYYSAGLGRWMNADPLEESDGPHRASFAGNDPVLSIDPIGLARKVFAFGGLWEVDAFFGIQSAGVVRETWFNVVTSDIGLNPLDWFPEDGVRAYDQTDIETAFHDAKKTLLIKYVDPNGCATYDSAIIVGFSNGGAAAIRMAEKLNYHGIAVDLIFTADPIPQGFGVIVGSAAMYKPSNVTRFVNHYQTRGVFAGHAVRGADVNEDHSADASITEAHTRGRVVTPFDTFSIESFVARRTYGAHLQVAYEPATIQGSGSSSLIESIKKVPVWRSDYRTRHAQ